jgi:endoglucanase
MGMRKLRGLFIFVFLLALSVFLLSACGTDNKQEGNTQTQAAALTQPAEVTQAAPTAVPTTAPTVAPTAEPTQAPAAGIAQAPQPDPGWSEDMKEMKDISSVDFVKEIKIGWNLGNTMDATGTTTLASEMSWGNPFTTQKLVDAIKEAGFNAIRIPTTWQNHLGPAPDYKIDPLWLKRVQEIVDYAMADEMYVILNAHHDDWYFPSYDNLDTAKDMLAKLWSQLAYRFQNYDEHLIFESMNEPRQKGTSFEWNGGNAEGWDCVNQLNAVFVDTVRGAGGNNPLRQLMIPPYAATSSTNAWDSFVVPEDGKITVSIHAYTPYNFALNKSGTADWSSAKTSDTREIDSLMDNIYNKFVSQGIPVIIGEFGAMNKNDNVAAREDWATYYVSKAAEKGIPCFWWDNGAFVGSGELFGLIDRLRYTWKNPEIVDALMKGLQ